MTDRERQLEAEVAWLRYGPEQMNLALRERNAVWNKSEEDGSESGDEGEEEKPEFEHIIVCGCKQCMASHRFGTAEPDNIFSAFDDDECDCVVKKCLKYHCEKAGLTVVECATSGEAGSSSMECHVVLMDLGKTWTVGYGSLLNSELFHESPGFNGLVSVFDIIGADHHPISEISATADEGGFFTDGSGTDYVAVARRRGFIFEGGETGAEHKARRAKEEAAETRQGEENEEDSSDEDDI